MKEPSEIQKTAIYTAYHYIDLPLAFVFTYSISHVRKIKQLDVFYTTVKSQQQDYLSKTTAILSVMSAFHKFNLHPLCQFLSGHYLTSNSMKHAGVLRHTHRHPHHMSCLHSFFSFPRAFLLWSPWVQHSCLFFLLWCTFLKHYLHKASPLLYIWHSIISSLNTSFWISRTFIIIWNLNSTTFQH